MKTKAKQNKNSLFLPAVSIVAAIAVIAVLALWLPGQLSGTKTLQNSQQTLANVPGKLELASYTQTTQAPLSFDTVSLAADSTSNTRLVSVSGDATKSVSPDEAVIALSVQTLDRSASKSQSDNAQIAANVMLALKTAGVLEADIKTTGYSLNEEFQWNETLRKSESTGYRTTNTIQVTVQDLAKTGSIIDAGVQAGANSVQSVYFKLSNELESQVKTQALQEAAANAKVKAQSIATGLGISLGRVYSASSTDNYRVPYYYNTMAEGAAKDSSATTPITAGDIEVSVTVNVQFEIA